MTDKTAEDKLSDRITDATQKKRKRTVRSYPACAFEEAVDFAKKVLEFGSGQPVRRLSLFDELGKSPDSGTSRQLIVNSNKYGLTEGSYTAEYIKLTADGLRAVDEEIQQRERAKARVFLAIENIEPFQNLYDRFKGNKLPAKTALVDAATETGLEKDAAEEAVDTFILNLRFVGLLQMLSGAERIVTLEHLLDSLPSSSAQPQRTSENAISSTTHHQTSPLMTAEQARFDNGLFLCNANRRGWIGASKALRFIP